MQSPATKQHVRDIENDLRGEILEVKSLLVQHMGDTAEHHLQMSQAIEALHVKTRISLPWGKIAKIGGALIAAAAAAYAPTQADSISQIVSAVIGSGQ